MRDNQITSILIGALLLLCSCSPTPSPEPKPDPATQARKDKIQAKEQSKPSKEAEQRKARSEAVLQKESVPINSSLPVIEDSTTAKRRTKEEIAHRAIAICLTALKAEGVDQAEVDRVVSDFGADKFFSPRERAFIKKSNPTSQEQINYTWRYEDFWVLLWALGYVDDLGRPDHQCDVKQAAKFLSDRMTDEFIRDAKLRDISAILDQADLVYRYHWAAVDVRVKGKGAPAKRRFL